MRATISGDDFSADDSSGDDSSAKLACLAGDSAAERPRGDDCLTPPERDRLVRALYSDLTLAEAAEAAGIDRRTVARALQVDRDLLSELVMLQDYRVENLRGTLYQVSLGLAEGQGRVQAIQRALAEAARDGAAHRLAAVATGTAPLQLHGSLPAVVSSDAPVAVSMEDAESSPPRSELASRETACETTTACETAGDEEPPRHGGANSIASQPAKSQPAKSQSLKPQPAEAAGKAVAEGGRSSVSSGSAAPPIEAPLPGASDSVRPKTAARSDEAGRSTGPAGLPDERPLAVASSPQEVMRRGSRRGRRRRAVASTN